MKGQASPQERAGGQHCTQRFGRLFAGSRPRGELTVHATDPTTRLRLALVTTELRVGGAERCLVHLAGGLQQCHFAPVVYSLAPPPPAEMGQLIQQLDSLQIPTHFVNVRRSWQLGRAVAVLRRLFGQQQPHLVQSFLFHANTVALLAAAARPAPPVVTGIRVADPSAWRHAVERWLSCRAAKIVCVSKSVAAFSRTVARLPAEKLVVIPNGVAPAATEAVDLQQLGLSPGRRALVVAGRLHRQKGVDWLLDLCPQLLSACPNHDLLLVGDGPERAALAARSRARGIAQRVHFAGWQPDLGPILMACDLLVLPSRWEGMPNVLLEAMACGKPVLANAVQGVQEVLGPLTDQQAVHPGDEQAFLRMATALLNDPELARQLGQKNREHVTTHFSLERMVQSYAQLYRQLVTG